MPFREDDLWNGYPEETNAPYGLAKKMLLVQGQAYREQYGFNVDLPHPGQPVRPGRQLRPGQLARDPGAHQEVHRRARSAATTTSRSGARAPRRASSSTSRTRPRGSCSPPSATTAREPVNLGVGQEITIRDLVGIIVRLTGFQGEIRWDATKPDGQPRRALDTSRARDRFGFTARTGFEDGLRATIAQYTTDSRASTEAPVSRPIACEVTSGTIGSEAGATVRRLAVVDHVGNAGGGSRFLRALVPALRRERPDLQITVFANERSMERDGLQADFEQAGVETRALRAVGRRSTNVLGVPGTRFLATRIQARTSEGFSRLPPGLTGNLYAELEQSVRGYDLAYFPWPYGIRPPRLSCPIVATLHDLNYKYFFGSSVFSARTLARLEPQMTAWTEQATIVTSSAFMAGEIRRFYPASPAPLLVRFAPFSDLTDMTDETARGHVRSLGVDGRYILYPTHPITHKNLGPLIAAMPLLRDAFPDLKLVFTGGGTEAATGRATSLAVEHGPGPVDVLGLGHVSNDEMDALVRCAAVVVSPSLYEAANAPGLDAWQYGVPVAMSDIPQFLEHIEVQGVWAAIFDPRDPRDIAAKIAGILRNDDDALALAAASATAIGRHTWRETARGYLTAFDDALRASQRTGGDTSPRVVSGGARR